jgi:ribonuclease III
MAEIEASLGHSFGDRRLFEQAMTHPSYAHEHPESTRDNQRMEFLGDAVLGMVIAQQLFERYPELPEGRLSRIKAALVCEDTLASLSEELGLGTHLRLGRGERATGGQAKASILADAMEALFAAVYHDGGYDAAATVVTRLFAERFEEARHGELVFDSKTALQEHVQARGDDRPHYEVEAIDGPPHSRVFTVSVTLRGERLASGRGRSKKEAEKRAAAGALRALRKRQAALDSPLSAANPGEGDG